MPGEDGGSITHWIDNLQAGDLDDAARRLWGRYFERLVSLARAKLRSSVRGAADEEDVVLSVFDSFFEGAATGAFPGLGGREDLWRLLVTITARKAANQLRREHQLKRGGGRVLGEALLDGQDPEGRNALAQIVGDEPTPEFAAMVAEEFRLRLESLRDETLRAIALMKMEGYSNAEIAARQDSSLRSVERKLEVIRGRWRQEERT
jgi:DNA-directed RNA polymerase specialized sigma24 family protein